mmetsp:Transcript_9590/g.29001  ORF Transcript_9590/g.29001 Transcript_9590/m.29001 type:complete len:396 (+) Transcript_9590:1148-2335(+)
MSVIISRPHALCLRQCYTAQNSFRNNYCRYVISGGHAGKIALNLLLLLLLLVVAHIGMLTEMFGASVPVVLPPMLGCSGGKLAGAVAKAGGLGFVAAGTDVFTPSEKLAGEIEVASDICGSGALGVGFLAHLMDETDRTLQKSLELEHPKLIWLSFGTLAKYRTLIEHVHRAGKKVVIMTHSVDEALAVREAGSDAVILQGGDAGGHGRQGTSPSTFSMVAEFRRKVGSNYPVWAAGGIADGAGLAATLAVGADMAVVGTRYTVCEESLSPAGFKDKVLGARTHSDSVISEVWDQFSPISWPAGTHARGLVNDTYNRFRRPVGSDPYQPSSEERERYNSGNYDIRAVWAGAGVALADSSSSATDLTLQLVHNARQRLLAASSAIDKLVNKDAENC